MPDVTDTGELKLEGKSAVQEFAASDHPDPFDTAAVSIAAQLPDFVL